MKSFEDIHFKDGKKTIDFVLVYKKSFVEKHGDKSIKFQTFINNLKTLGLHLEFESFEVNEDIVFIKIHVSDESVIFYSDLCNVTLECEYMDYRPVSRPPLNFMATPLTKVELDNPINLRAPGILTPFAHGITSTERILVIHKLLVRIKFGSEKNEYGLSKLMDEKLIIDYYPIHDGPYTWTETGPLNDRQLLVKYWASYNMWYKKQPLQFIQRYYGSEFGFYFAWIDHYVKMLILPAIVGLLVVIYGLATLSTDENIRSKEICNSSLVMCPRCHYSKCNFEQLKSSCLASNIAYLFDNTMTYVFAIFISLWSTVFTEMWHRREAVLRLQWALSDVEHDTTTRPEYLQKIKHFKFSPVTENEEPYIPLHNRCIRYTVTFVTVVFAFLLVLFAVIGVMAYRISMNILLASRDTKVITPNRRLIASATGASMSATFIILLKQVFKRISLWLTIWENHRTQFDFDNAYVYKLYGFEFVNNYAAPMYIAFFKGRFFTHPGDIKVWKTNFALDSDICDPSGCGLDLGIQLIIIMMVKVIGSNIAQYFIPIAESLFRRVFWKVPRKRELPFYQEDFLGAKTDHFFLVDEYLEIMIQYGFMVFFISLFPLAPCLAFVTIIFEVRTDASKLSRNCRRPIPQRVNGLGAWLTIMQSVTYMGVVTNAFVIAFTSSAVDFQIYRFGLTDTSRGFHNTTISAFDISEFWIIDPKLSKGLCYYPGRRYPPNHPLKYELTTEYWFLLGVRFLVVIIFEHFLIMVKGILAYSIPDIPKSVLIELQKEKWRRKTTVAGGSMIYF